MTFAFVGCGGDSGANVGSASCTITTSDNNIHVHSDLSGIGSYDVVGVYTAKVYDNYTEHVIINSYTEHYANSQYFELQCASIKEENWYSNLKCDASSNTITYTDIDETTIEDAVAKWKNFCND